MGYKKKNVSAGLWLLFSQIFLVAVIIYAMVKAGSFELSIEGTGSVMVIVVLASTIIMAFLFMGNKLRGVIAFSLIGAAAYIVLGCIVIKNISEVGLYSRIKNLSSGDFESGFNKVMFYGLMFLPMIMGISYLFLAISIIISSKKQKVSGVGAISVVASVVGVVPGIYFLGRSLYELIRSVIKYNKYSDIFISEYNIHSDILVPVCIIFGMLILSLLFLLFGIISGVCCYEFRGSVYNSYTPISSGELDLSDPYAAPAGGSYNRFNNSRSNNNVNAQTGSSQQGSFYSPFGAATPKQPVNPVPPVNDTPVNQTSQSTFYSPFGAQTQQPTSVTYENEKHFTATTADYVEQSFDTGLDKATQTAQSEAAATETPRIIINDGTTLAEKNTEYSSADEIEKFRRLADAGILTEEEFEEKKRKLLGI